MWFASTDTPFDVEKYLNIPVAVEASEAWRDGVVKPVDLTGDGGGKKAEAEPAK